MIVNVNKPKYFCQQYWEKVLKTNPIILSNKSYCNKHVDLHLANMDILSFSEEPTYDARKLQKIYKTTDLELKLANPISKKMTFWRLVNEPTLNGKIESIPAQLDLYNKCLNLKKGDILYMKQYAFMADRKNTVKNLYACSEENILFKIVIDENTKIWYEKDSTGYGILPRASKFICTGTKNKKKYKQINLKLVPFDYNPTKEHKSVIEKIKNFFK